MRPISLVLCLAASAAEVTFSSLTATSVTDDTAIITWTVTGSVNSSKRVCWDTKAYFDANGVFRNCGVQNTAESFSTMAMPIAGLTASTTYTACPSVTNTGGANASICTSSGASSSRVEFTTLAAQTATPTLPDVSGLDTTYPASFAATLTVANDCSDFSSKWTTAFSATYAGQDVKLVLPSDSVRTNTCTLPDVPGGGKSGGTHWVVVQSSGTIPDAGTRISYGHGEAGALTTLANTNIATSGIAALDSNSGVRFVGIWFQTASTASVGDGDPRIAQYLWRIDSNVGRVIFDRCVFGKKYPHRMQYTFYGYGSDIAIIDSFAVAQIWKPWISNFTQSRPTTATISVAATTYVGVGNKVCTVLPWSIVLSGSTTTTGHIYIDTSDCALRFETAAAITATCLGIICQTDAGLTVPATGRTLTWDGTARVHAITSSTFRNAGNTANTFNLWNGTAISDLTGPSGSVSESEWNSHLFYGDRGGGGDLDVDTLVIRNNYCLCTGIDIFITPTNVNWTDISITGNTFASEGHIVAYASTSAPFTATRRFHIETKAGKEILISGNQFLGGYVGEVNTSSPAISLKNDGKPVTDVTVQNNWITNEPAFIYTASQINASDTFVPRGFIERVLVTNNLVLTNPFIRRQPWAGTDSLAGDGGYFYWGNWPTRKITFTNNTSFQNRGSYATAILMSDGHRSSLDVRDNIFFIHQGYQRGVQSFLSEMSDASPTFVGGAGNDGTTALGRALPGGYTMTGNIFISGCNAPSTCTDATTSGSLVANLYLQYPGLNNFEATGTFGERQDAVGWANRTVAYPSSFARAGTAGINAATLMAAIGSPAFGPVRSGSLRKTGGASY